MTDLNIDLNKNSPSILGAESKAVKAIDDDHFENTSYSLKRTPSMGLLDDFIDPTKKLLNEDFAHTNHFENDPLNIVPKSLSMKNLNKLNNNEVDSSPNNESLISLSQNSQLSVNDSSVTSTPSTYSADSENPNQTTERFQPHDDNDITFEPRNRVDYFSYDWTDREIIKSWRYVVDRKKTIEHNSRIENSRLENASWRTWARAKYGLKTVTPESINWKKDIDVSWLYGPKCNLETESDVRNHLQEGKVRKGLLPPSRSSNHVTTAATFLEDTTVKPILKQRKISEKINANSDLFKINMLSERNKSLRKNFASPIIEAISSKYELISEQNTSYSVSPNMGSVSSRKEMSPMNLAEENLDSPQKLLLDEGQSQDNRNSSTSISTSGTLIPSSPVSEDSVEELPVFADSKKPAESLKSSFLAAPASKSELDAKKQRTIHFNDRVEQCRIVDYFTDSEDEPDDGAAEESSDEEEDGGFMINVKGKSSRSLSASSAVSAVLRATVMPELIEEMPAASIRFHDEEESDDSEFESENEETYYSLFQNAGTNDSGSFNGNFNSNAMSHNVNTNRGYEYYYDYNSVYVPEDLLVNNDQVEDLPKNLAGGLFEEKPSDKDGEGFILTGDDALSLSSEDTNSYSGLSFGHKPSAGGLTKSLSSSNNVSGSFGVNLSRLDRPAVLNHGSQKPCFSLVKENESDTDSDNDEDDEEQDEDDDDDDDDDFFKFGKHNLSPKVLQVNKRPAIKPSYGEPLRRVASGSSSSIISDVNVKGLISNPANDTNSKPNLNKKLGDLSINLDK